MFEYVDEQIIDDIALGASVLGTGGGGDPFIGTQMAKHALKLFGSVMITPLSKVDDDEIFVPCSMVGATTVIMEKIMTPNQFLLTIDTMSSTLKTRIAGTFPIEIGGVNSLIPFIVAAQKQIPVVDCDGVGRAFPEVQMVSFYLDDLPSGPNTLADEKGNTLVLYPIDGLWSERFARAITEQMGAAAAMCDYPLTGRALKKSAIPGTLTLAQHIGQTLRLAWQSGSNPIHAITQALNGHVIASGKIIDVKRQTMGGFARGHVLIEGRRNDKGEQATVLFQNEFLLAYRSSAALEPTQENLLAVVPDLISIIDSETGRPIVTENLFYGQRVDVVASPCHAKWRSTRGLAVAGPRYFGYPVDYVAIEQLVNR
ncbi:DUF917 domain-containing protein [Symbiopectobacterium sp.]|uniref:DUF917 domain-containing protein n=1 Tax=Symbiopectobacterium sp. TaxID=2952789 RepID=UPI003F306110